MNDGYTCTINSNKLLSSINILNSINNIINNNDMFDYIQEIETFINDINFEHGNCIENYKEDLTLLYTKVDEIKKDIISLIDSLEFSVENINNTGTIKSEPLKKLISFYKNTSTGDKINKLLNESSNNIAMRKVMDVQNPNSNSYSEYNNVTVIPPVETNQQEIVEKPYSTVPVGLGIAATGISAAAGTVYVDSLYGNQNNKPKKFEIENYNELDKNNEETDDYYENENNQPVAEPYPKIEEEYVPPYHASRIQPSENVFYDFDEEK